MSVALLHTRSPCICCRNQKAFLRFSSARCPALFGDQCRFFDLKRRTPHLLDHRGSRIALRFHVKWRWYIKHHFRSSLAAHHDWLHRSRFHPPSLPCRIFRWVHTHFLSLWTFPQNLKWSRRPSFGFLSASPFCHWQWYWWRQESRRLITIWQGLCARPSFASHETMWSSKRLAWLQEWLRPLK